MYKIKMTSSIWLYLYYSCWWRKLHTRRVLSLATSSKRSLCDVADLFRSEIISRTEITSCISSFVLSLILSTFVFVPFSFQFFSSSKTGQFGRKCALTRSMTSNLTTPGGQCCTSSNPPVEHPMACEAIKARILENSQTMFSL